MATTLRGRDGAKGVDSDCTDTLIPVSVAFQTRGSNIHVDADITGNLGINADRASGSAPMLANGMAVRRLTVRECLRLQSFPDDYFDAVTYRGKPLADGSRYKMIGNSWNTDTVRWIFRRIDAQWRGGA